MNGYTNYKTDTHTGTVVPEGTVSKDLPKGEVAPYKDANTPNTNLTAPQKDLNPTEVALKKYPVDGERKPRSRDINLMAFLQDISMRLKHAQTANYPTTITTVIEELDEVIRRMGNRELKAYNPEVHNTDTKKAVL